MAATTAPTDGAARATPACTVHYLTALWVALHSYARTYPDAPPPQAHQDAYYAAIDALRYILPCAKCRPDFAARLGDGSALRAALSSGREAVIEWTVALHNQVNASLGKRVVTRAEADAQWATWSGSVQGCAECATPPLLQQLQQLLPSPPPTARAPPQAQRWLRGEPDEQPHSFLSESRTPEQQPVLLWVLLLVLVGVSVAALAARRAVKPRAAGASRRT